MKRGVVHHHDVRTYFPWGRELVQDEPGDSIWHHFHIEHYYYCQMLWWYAFGTVARQDSPSISPFFAAHYTTPPPPTERDYCEPIGTGGQLFWSFTCMGVTFKAHSTYPLSHIAIAGGSYHDHSEDWHMGWLRLYNATNDLPVGPPIFEIPVWPGDFPDHAPSDWVLFTVPSHLITADQQYSICLGFPDGQTRYSSINWASQDLSSTCEDSCAIRSLYYGDSWDLSVTPSRNFQTFTP